MKQDWLRTGFLCLAIAVSSAQAWSAGTAPAERPGGKETARTTGPDLVTLNFVNAEIEGVVRVVGQITGEWIRTILGE